MADSSTAPTEPTSAPEATPQVATPEEPASETTPADSADAQPTASETPAETAPSDAAPSTNQPTDTSQSAAPSPTSTDPASTDPNTADADTQETKPEGAPPKKGLAKFLNKKILMVVGIVLIVLIVGFVLLHFIKGKSKPKPQAKTSTPEASQSAGPALPDCISGYKPYTNKLFSICTPISMGLKETEASSSAQDKQYIFSDDAETLEVDTNYKDNLNKYNCVSTQVITISGVQAQSYTIKDYDPTDGCLKTINSYAVLVSSGDNKPVFYIGLSKKSGSYESDNGEFDVIENSFQINQ